MAPHVRRAPLTSLATPARRANAHVQLLPGPLGALLIELPLVGVAPPPVPLLSAIASRSLDETARRSPNSETRMTRVLGICDLSSVNG